MIDPKELRIGNLVRFIAHLPIGYNRPTLYFSEVIEIRSGNVETTVSVDKYKDVAPIDLTEDILVSSGGIRISDTEISFKDNDEQLPELLIKLDSDKYYIYLNNQCKFNNPVLFVHHFQNLYYSLMGKDIKMVIPVKYR